ncbi:cyclic nucleotide-binding domain-containing protein [Acaryochloris sp. IP29b_bin.148]|uniref:cyclic nucleotide-binding domain-containing protein n=1 Tax=Acaryochloris sp. IP29b_bin.148 TaxID=2969218 RepID=UPI00261C60EC|nr:cyclic nucleotide-binding domain-containing protein [Acaryochloris sp. IP29b_bin.148]
MSEEKESSLLVYFQPGELIFAAGEEGHHAYIIESGQVDIFVTTAGKEVSFKTLAPGVSVLIYSPWAEIAEML